MWNNISSVEDTVDTRMIKEARAPTRPRRIQKQMQSRSRRPESKILSRRQFHTTHEERPISWPGTKAPVARDDPSRETSASTNATAKSACEDDWAEQGPPAKPGAQKHLARGVEGMEGAGGWGADKVTKKHSATDRKHPPHERAGKIWRPWNQWSHRDRLQALRVRELTTPYFITILRE